MNDSNSVITLKELAERAIAKHSRRIFKHEAGVLKDKDPEELHQMRVGMRRLRSAIAGLALAIDLPKNVTVKNIAKIGHSIGRLRDLDVLLAVLTDNYRPLLPAKEQKKLDKVIKSLGKKRQHELKQVRKTLNSKLYLNFKQELNDWLEEPKYTVSGDYSLDFVLSDLLLPQVCQFLIHPGWLVGVNFQEGEIESSAILNMDAIDRLLKLEGSLLHDLRKSAKKTRYSLELFSQFYGESYHLYLKKIEGVQEILGQIQDIHVLTEVLEKVLRSPIAEKLPELASLLLKTQSQKWLEWQISQKQFLADKTRTEFRQIIQQA
ncbi:MAG: CHAD domain-containing protein [Pleurocapsa sp. SU_5_0]|nr:CHAD domain-containing protein [Pleurocapsa sp. SU_5_0]NJR46302.1 CHAD domain-containing protein [Hyellaceae cyanobacterium CSU_1_1]